MAKLEVYYNWPCIQIVSAVSELIIAQLLYLQYKEPGKDIYFYINSTGTCRADGSVVGFETEATAIYDTMNYVGSDVSPEHLICFCKLFDRVRSCVFR